MDFLEKHFDTAFNAPDGIKKLRELILTLAMQGKLVPQDPSDQPASELLKEIQKEKEKLIKEGKIKKQKPLPPINPDEFPYEIPTGWEWVRLGDYLQFEYGNNLPSAKRTNNGGVDVYGSNGIVGSHNDACVFSKCIVIGRKGSAGALSLSLKDKCWVTDVAYSCVPPTGIDLYYSFHLFKTLNLDKLGKGIKPGLNRNEAYCLIFALPPLAEQKRIVEKIDQLMARCDELEQLRDEQEQKRLKVHKSAIHRLVNAEGLNGSWSFIKDNFSELYSVKENVAELRKAILSLAMQGKLVPQDPSDQPASELMKSLIEARNKIYLDNIDNAEVKTMTRKLAKLPTPKLPYSLPDNWIVINLINCCEYLVDCHNKTAPYIENGIPIIRTTNVRNRTFRYTDLKYVSEKTYLYWSRRCHPKSDDIIFTREAPMGEAAIIPDKVKFCLGQRTMLIRAMHDYIDNKFLLYVITEQNILNLATENAIGSTVKHLRVGDVENLSLPLPPLAEQKRIVEKIDQLMALCDELEAQIGSREATQTSLLKSIMAQV